MRMGAVEILVLFFTNHWPNGLQLVKSDPFARSVGLCQDFSSCVRGTARLLLSVGQLLRFVVEIFVIFGDTIRIPSSRLQPRLGVRRLYEATIPVLYVDLEVERVLSNSTAFTTITAVKSVSHVSAGGKHYPASSLTQPRQFQLRGHLPGSSSTNLATLLPLEGNV